MKVFSSLVRFSGEELSFADEEYLVYVQAGNF
jgi:hypothetical protein